MNKETEVEKKGINKYGLSEEERKVIKDLVNQRFDFINYKHQPQSYWKNLNDPLNEILKNVTGTQITERQPGLSCLPDATDDHSGPVLKENRLQTLA